MDEYRFKSRVWRTACFLLLPAARRVLGLEMEPLPAGGPYLVVCNHVTNLDPLMLAAATPRKSLTFIASENILRLHPRLRGALFASFDAILRRKGASGAKTALQALRALRAGRNVCVFAEGETSWNGLTEKIQEGTASLLRASGAGLVTYRIHGGYFTWPRWADGLRRGRVRGVVAGVHPASALGEMSPDEINGLIQREISEDAFADQRKERVPYRGKKRAQSVSSLLFLCPRCRGIGTLRGDGNDIRCSCGLDVRLNECLLPEGDAPFADLSEWDRWQREAFASMAAEGASLREDRDDLTLWRIPPEGAPVVAAAGSLAMDRDFLTVGKSRFPLGRIRDLALLQNKKLAFSFDDLYYELHAPSPLCLRKYLLYWRQVRDGACP